MHLSCEGCVCIVEVSAYYSCQPNVTTIGGEVLCGVHPKHLAHMHHFRLALLTEVNACIKNQHNMIVAVLSVTKKELRDEPFMHRAGG